MAIPIDKTAFLREACRRSFWMFFLHAFGAKQYCAANPADNWVNLQLHFELCNWLDTHVKDWERTRLLGERKAKKLLVCIPRGFGKSTVGSALDCWLQVRDPELAITISSYDEDQAKAFLGVAKAVFEGRSAYGHFEKLFGNWKPVDERPWQATRIIHGHRQHFALRDYSMAVASVGSGITGTRPDVFRLDDPIVQEKLTKESNWTDKARNHLDSAEYAVKSNGLHIVMLTRYSEDDVGGKILTEEGIATLTGLYVDHKKGPWHAFYLAARDRELQPVLPQVWPDERLKEMEKKNPLFYASQLMNDPSASSTLPFQSKDLETVWIRKEDLPSNLHYSIHCDTAFKDKLRRERGDWNVIQIWGHEHGTGRVYYVDGWADNTSDARSFTDKLVSTLGMLHRGGNQPFALTMDASPGRTGLYAAFLHDALATAGLPPINLLELRRGGKGKFSEESRVRTAVYAWKAGKVKVVRGAGDAEALAYEMTHIGTSPHDDRRDAACDVFHEEVYSPRLMGTAQVGAVPLRPYADLLALPFERWTDGEKRWMYDQDEEEEGVTAWVR